MSFLFRATPAVRIALRPSPRCFSTTIISHKSATESVKDSLKQVDRAVSDVAVAGIDKGVEMKDKAAAAAGVETSKAEGTAQEMAGRAQGSASQMAGQAQGSASQMAGQAKGKANEMAGQAKGKANELGANKSHATDPKESVVPESIQKAAPEGVEKALPDSVHPTKK